MKTEVLIVGAGPAGSVCASLLLRAGVDCLLVDHASFPREKICGGCLSPKAWRLLDELLPGVAYDYQGARRLRLMVNGHRGCEFSSEQELRIVHRRDFDHVLLRRYLSAGGAFLQDGLDSIAEQSDGTIRATLRSGQTVACRYLVGADGSGSRVRRHLTGRAERGILAMEQYVPKGVFDQTDDVVVDLSRRYARGGYFYKFPAAGHDVIGYGDHTTTPARFRQVLAHYGVPETKLRGAHIYLGNDYPLREHIILIGDAGGFANRLTCEGLYDAFKTASHAATAIVEGRPFGEVNRKVFAKMKKETLFSNVFFSSPGFALLRLMCRFPRLVKWCFDTKMKRESFLPFRAG